MKKTMLFVLAMMLCFALAGCGRVIKIDLPFACSEVEQIEIFHFVDPMHAEKKVVTKAEDLKGLCTLFESIQLKDKATQPVAGGSVTSFRFHLSDGTEYEIVYSSIAVKSGRIKTSGSETDYFTSADIGASWNNYDYEAVDAPEDELPALYP